MYELLIFSFCAICIGCLLLITRAICDAAKYLKLAGVCLRILANAERIRSKLDGTRDPNRFLPQDMEGVDVTQRGDQAPVVMRDYD